LDSGLCKREQLFLHDFALVGRGTYVSEVPAYIKFGG
jgi:hypothetical protein